VTDKDQCCERDHDHDGDCDKHPHGNETPSAKYERVAKSADSISEVEQAYIDAMRAEPISPRSHD
jgi:hypothetical protein